MDSKPFYASKTFWGIVLMALAPALKQAGLQFNDADIQNAAELLGAVVGGAVGIWGRYTAARGIGLLPGGGGAAALCLMLGLGLAAGCGIDPNDPRYTAWKDIEVAKAQALKDIEVAKAENPRVSRAVLEPTTPGQPVTFNGKLTVEIAHTEGTGQPVQMTPTPMPKSDTEVLVEGFKAAPGEVVRGVLGYKIAEVGGEVLGKAFDKAGNHLTNVGNTTGDMNTKVSTGNNSLAGGNVTGPRDPTTTTTTGQ